MKLVNNLDLDGFAIKNGGFEQLPEDPIDPFVGQTYFNTTTKRTKSWNGNSWDVLEKGEQGFSAYEIAVQEGFIGTEAEWIVSLNGTNGSSILSGAGVPSGGLGDNGDSYLNTTNGDVYSKTGGTWSITGNIKGVQGEQGIQGEQGEQGIQGIQGIQGVQGVQGVQGFSILSGAGVPTTQGVNGDTYLNTINGDTYLKSGGSWTLNGNIRGPQGIQGIQGIQGEQGDQGIQGVKGDKGDQGEQGIQGDTGDIYIDIKNFGVVGDGVTDDYLAWQSALNSVPNYGGTIYAGSGINGNHFLCSNTLKIKSNTKIIGIGLREPRFLVSHNNAALELNGEGIVLENIYVDAAGALGIGGGNGNAIDIIGTDTFNTSWIEIKSIIATSKNISLNIDASARTNQPSSIFVNNSSFFRSHTSGNSISVKNTRYVFLDNIGCYATSGAVYSDIFIDSFSNNLMFSKANVIGNIVFNGNNPNVSNINSGGDITINSTSGNYTGILTTGHFNLTNISANNLFSVNLLGSATVADNGSENKQLAFVGHIIQQGTKSISPSAIIENNSTYHFRWGLDGNSGFIGSTNSTPVMIKTNSVNRIIIKEDGINVFADNSAAIAAGLSVNTIYRTSDGFLKIVY